MSAVCVVAGFFTPRPQRAGDLRRACRVLACIARRVATSETLRRLSSTETRLLPFQSEPRYLGCYLGEGVSQGDLGGFSR
jgi:hypothetical protein